MAHVVGLLFEDGPGDTLRFVHALRRWESTTPWDRATVLTTSEALPLAGGLYSHQLPAAPQRRGDFWFAEDGPVTWTWRIPEWKWGEVGWDEPTGEAGIIEANVASIVAGLVDFKPPVVHAFHRFGDQEALRVDVPFAGHVRRRIDRNRLMRVERYSQRDLAPLVAIEGRPRIAVFMRRHSSRDVFRNSPSWFVEEVCTATTALDFDAVFFGPTTGDERERIRRTPRASHSVFRGSYYEQMVSVRSFQGAVGVTSGGLDLAAAAGIPILRVGEFQNRGFSNGWGAWGASYNSFLANDLNVGLAFHDTFEQFPRQRFATSATDFIAVVRGPAREQRLRRHVLLPEGENLDAARLPELVAAFATCVGADQ